MKKRRLLAALSVVGSLLVAATVAQAQEPILVAEAGGVEVWSVPQDGPADGWDATNIVLKTNEANKLVTFENILIENVHHLWAGNGIQPVMPPGNAQGPNPVGPLYLEEWLPYDSHLLITSDMVGGGAGASYAGVLDTNDGSTGDLGLPAALGGAAPAMGGIGPIRTKSPTDAFFLDTPFQGSEVEFAYLVRPADVAAADNHTTLTFGVLGEGIINSGEPGGAFFDAVGVPVYINGHGVCEESTSQFCFDFDFDDEGAEVYGDAAVITENGNPGGYLKITDAANGQRGKIILPPVAGVDGQFVIGGRTGGANANHHLDNLEAHIADGNISISVDLRVGGGTADPADGFSFSFVAPGDPVLNPDTDGWAGIGTEPANLPEEGTQTGISIGFDEWQSGDAPANDSEYAGPNAKDVIGISLRVDGVLIGQAVLPTKNGALDDFTSLQTGPNADELGWARLTINAPLSGASLGNTVVTWKGQIISVPEPTSGLMALMSLLSLGLLRRKNG